MALVDRVACAPGSWARRCVAPAQDRGIRPVYHSATMSQASGFVRASEAAALRRFPVRTRTWCANLRREFAEAAGKRRRCRRPWNAERHARVTTSPISTSRPSGMIRRAILKADGDPGLSGAVRQSARCPCPMAGEPAASRSRPAIHRPKRRAEGDRPGLRRHDQRGLHPHRSSAETAQALRPRPPSLRRGDA
jgi:hypothetical protein